MNEENKNYEIGFLAKDESDREGLVKILKENQFSIINDGQISRIKLAFPIKKEDFAYFGFFHFSGDPANIKNLSATIKTESKILRFTIVPQPIFREREGRYSEGGHSDQSKSFSEQSKAQATHFPFSSPAPKKTVRSEALSNEALEKKLEEILK